MKEKTKYYKATQESPNEWINSTMVQKSKIKVVCHELYSLRDGQKMFLTPEEALSDYNKALDNSITKFNLVYSKLEQLRNEFDFDISYTMEGDTHGIYEDYQYISLNIDGYEILFKYE